MGYPDAIAYTGDRTFQSTIKPNFVVEDLNCHGHENNLKGLSMSVYPNSIQILSKFYLDQIFFRLNVIKGFLDCAQLHFRFHKLLMKRKFDFLNRNTY